MLTNIITAVIIIISMIFLLKAMWKTAKVLIIPIQIILFLLLCFVCFKIFFSKENVKKLNQAVKDSEIAEINQSMLEKGSKSIKQAVGGSEKSAPEQSKPEQASTPVKPAPSIVAEKQLDEAEEIPGTRIFRKKNANDPTTVKVIPLANTLQIICSFKGKTAFSRDRNARFNAATAEKLCLRGIFLFCKVDSSQNLEISGLNIVKKVSYNGLEHWTYEIPRAMIKITEKNEQPELPVKKPVKVEKKSSGNNDFFNMDTDKIFED